MKPKNVMLLGFINRAVDYLDRHMDEEPDARLAELKNIDLASLKDELSDNLDASLGTMQSTMSTLLKAGNEAFDKFIENNHGSNGVADDFNKIFDVDLDDNKKDKQEELARLLSFYNLENDFEIDDSQEISTPINQKQDTVDYVGDDEFMKQIAKNATSDDVDSIVPIERDLKESEAIDSIFSEIVENENKKVEKKEVNNTQQYVSTLIDDLKAQLDKEESFKKKLEDKNKDVYNRISKLYPYLPAGFVRSVYELKDSIASDYPLDKKIIVLHRIAFKDVENLRKFVEIGMNHDYTINADEKKMIVDIFKEFTNSDGKILTNIYEIANQGYLLEGEYEGYNVIVNE